MTKLALILTLACVAGVAEATDLTHGSVGIGSGVSVPSQNRIRCSEFTFLNYDGSAENGYCWQYGGILPPYYGAFAECYHCGHGGGVWGIQLMLTGVGFPCGPFDAYVWDDAGGMPGNVLSLTTGLNPCPVATWPNVSTHEFDINFCDVGLSWWIGYWADTAGGPCGYFVAADLDGPGGCPFTNVAPGIGYPTGWQDVSPIWGETRALGIGACGICPFPPPPPGGACCLPDGSCIMVDLPGDCQGQYMGDYTSCNPNPCEGTPVEGTSWGRIKGTYR